MTGSAVVSGADESRPVHQLTAAARTRATGGDRRINLITLTPADAELLGEVTRAARTHNDTLLDSLTTRQRTQLASLLSTLAKNLGPEAAVHPGYALTSKERG